MDDRVHEQIELDLTPYMFSHMTMNWRGNPLRTYRTVVELTGNTGMRNGLCVSAGIDVCIYEACWKISDVELKTINMVSDQFHGNWNYMIKSWKDIQ